MVKNIPVCMPPSCEMAMIFMALNSEDFVALGERKLEESSCEAEESWKFKDTGGMECLIGSFENYGMDIFLDSTAEFEVVEKNVLTPFAPNMIMELEDEVVQNICEVKNLSDDHVEQICDFKPFVDSAIDMKSECETLGGKYKEVDMSFTYEEEFKVDVFIRNYPYCIDKSCKKNEFMKYMNVVFETDFELDITIINSPIDQCKEKKKDLFNLKFEDGEVKTRRCSFLGRMKNLERKKKLCGKSKGPRGSVAPKVSCPATCCKCAEYPDNKFVWKKEQGSSKKRSCRWLSKRSQEEKDAYCKKGNIQGGGYGPAYSACPYTCGTCET